MTGLHFAVAFALLSFGAPGLVRADEPGRDTQREISHLLHYLEASKCAFHRNGIWYSSLEARAHLEEKYRYLQSRSRVVSAEDFLARAATASSVSGLPYQVRCDGQEAVGSAKWLGLELERYRSTRPDKGK